jgi:hypothetical protein
MIQLRNYQLEGERHFELSGAPLCACGCGEHPIIRRGKYSRYLYGHDKHPAGWNLKLSANERQEILGTLLGDGSIGFPNKRSTNCRLAWTHGPDQAWWMGYKAQKLSRLGVKVRIAPNAGYGTTSIVGVSARLPCLTDIRSLVYGAHERKTVCQQWLDEIGERGLAWWYCDDGSYVPRKRYATFHTEGYTLSENELIRDWFIGRFGGAAIDENTKGHFYVRLNVKPTLKIFSAIERFVPPMFSYKIGKRDTTQLGFGI